MERPLDGERTEARELHSFYQVSCGHDRSVPIKCSSSLCRPSILMFHMVYCGPAPVWCSALNVGIRWARVGCTHFSWATSQISFHMPKMLHSTKNAVTWERLKICLESEFLVQSKTLTQTWVQPQSLERSLIPENPPHPSTAVVCTGPTSPRPVTHNDFFWIQICVRGTNLEYYRKMVEVANSKVS